MNYLLEWSCAQNLENDIEFYITCELNDHPLIKIFRIKIKKNLNTQELEYNFWISNTLDRSGVDFPYFNVEKTLENQKKIAAEYHLMHDITVNDAVSSCSFDLYARTKQSAFQCLSLLLRQVSLKEEDRRALYSLVQTQTLPIPYLLQYLLTLVNQSKISEACQKALAFEKGGCRGIIYQLASKLVELNHIQSAYNAFASIASTDVRFTDAQLIAAQLAVRSEISFPNLQARLKALLIHCRNAHKEGEVVLENYLRQFADLNQLNLPISNCGESLESLANLSYVIAQQREIISTQSNEIKHLNKQIADRHGRSENTPSFFS